MRRLFHVLVTLPLIALIGPASVAADEASSMNRVDFSVARDTQVENDRATALLTVTDEDRDPAALAGRVNEAMAFALERARLVPAVEPRSGSYSTRPITLEGKIRRWRARQELWLESGDLAALTALVGELQSRLELASMSFFVSPERQREVQDSLITEALDGYAKRALLVQRELGASGHELVHLSIETHGGAPVPRYAGARVMAASAEMAPPALEAGTSRVSVTLRATIELD